MSSFLQALQDRSPLIWIYTFEPERIIDTVTSLVDDKRETYLLDPISGLSIWDSKSSSWKIILVPSVNPMTGQEEEVPIFKTAAAFSYILEQEQAIFIVRNAHAVIKEDPNYLTFFSALYYRFRNSFYKDTTKTLPTQVVMLASTPEVPEEISAMTTFTKWAYPTVPDLTVTIKTIAENYSSDVIKDVPVEDLAKASLGLSERDAIEAYLRSIRETGTIDYNRLKELRMERLRASSFLDVKDPTVLLTQVGGLDNAKELIRKAIWIQQNRAEAEAHGIKPLRRFILLGLSGCGKSFLCEAAANGLNMPLAKAGVAKAFNKFVGESEKNIEIMFDQINAMAPIVAWIDEIGRDLSGGGSSDYVDGGVTSRVHGAFLTRMQELSDDVFVFAAANDIERLPPEMLRADRFDKILFVGFPSLEERKEIFRLYLPKTEVPFDIELLALETPCFTGAEIKSLVEATVFDIVPTHRRPITTDDILRKKNFQKNRIWIRHKSLAVNMYRAAYDDYEWASSSQYAEAMAIVNGQEPTPSTDRSPKSSIILK